MIKAIETLYAGCLFRSRLEARWAVFFDIMGIRWEYEPEGYLLSNGDWYLPDFWLPGYGWFAEVKPMNRDFSKARQLAQDSKKLVWLCEGIPDFRHYRRAAGLVVNTEMEMGQPWIRLNRKGEEFGWYHSYHPIEDGYISYNKLGAGDPVFERAIVAARSARF